MSEPQAEPEKVMDMLQAQKSEQSMDLDTAKQTLAVPSKSTINLKHDKIKAACAGFCLTDNEILKATLSSKGLECELLKLEPQKKSKTKIKNSLYGLSVKNSVIRKTQLPFRKAPQIEAVIPQDAEDHLIFTLTNPVFGFHWYLTSQDKNSSAEVLYVAMQESMFNTNIQAYQKVKAMCHTLVIQELASWPLLYMRQMLGDTQQILIVDCSVQPFCLLHVTGIKLNNFRWISVQESTSSALKDTIELVEEIRERHHEISKVIWLGTLPGDVSVQGLNIEQISLTDLGLEAWLWLRPVGLAYAATSKEWPERILPISKANKEDSSDIRTWYKGLAISAAAAVIVSLGLFTKSAWLKHKNKQLENEIAQQFYQVSPESARISDPVKQLRSRRKKVQTSLGSGGPSLPKVIETFQSKVSPTSNVKWNKVTYTTSNIMAQGEIPSYDKLEQLHNTLQGVQAFSEIKIANQSKRRGSQNVEFTLEIDR